LANVTVALAPAAILCSSNAPSFERIEWLKASPFVHVTTVPTFTVSAAGLNAKSTTSTAADAVVATGSALVDVAGRDGAVLGAGALARVVGVVTAVVAATVVTVAAFDPLEHAAALAPIAKPAIAMRSVASTFPLFRAARMIFRSSSTPELDDVASQSGSVPLLGSPNGGTRARGTTKKSDPERGSAPE
jgi:hypothetical protein